MSYFSLPISGHSPYLRPLTFCGKSHASQSDDENESAVSSPQSDEDADLLSIYTDSDAEDQYVSSQALLSPEKDNEPLDTAARQKIREAIETLHASMTRFKKAGRAWQKNSDAIGNDYETVLDRLETTTNEQNQLKRKAEALESTEEELAQARKRQKTAEDQAKHLKQKRLEAEWKTKQEEAEVKRLLDKLVKAQTELETLKNKHDEEQINQAGNITTIDAQLQRLTKESQAIMAKLGLSPEDVEKKLLLTQTSETR